MSGNAFKEYKTILSSYEHFINVRHVLNAWFKKGVRPAGSTQFFESEGGSLIEPKTDLDFVVQASREEIIDTITDNPYIKTYKKFGNTISTLWETASGYIHVDLMTSENVGDEVWIMSGGSRNIKGVVRNILLCFLARLKSESETERLGVETKWTIAFPGGMGLKENNLCLKRETSPTYILGNLGLKNTESHIESAKTFEGLVDLIEWNNPMIERFSEYAKEQWLYKISPEVIDAGLEYIKNHKMQK